MTNNNWCDPPSAYSAYKDYLSDVVLWAEDYNSFLAKWLEDRNYSGR